MCQKLSRYRRTVDRVALEKDFWGGGAVAHWRRLAMEGLL